MNYISENTSNQYFITTHSAHLLDSCEAAIFHIKHNKTHSIVETLSTTREKSNLCKDLGYKASDILQSNCIIWVEGPSDRIYIKFWLDNHDSSLIEGIHYSIMFFGGRLFSHLTAKDDDEIIDDINDMVSLRNLNRNSCIIFDSDKDSPQKHLSNTKKRLKKEFNSGDGFAWVTKGREIENYINYDIIEGCVKIVHPSAIGLLMKDQWANLLKYKRTLSKKAEGPTANKVKVAKEYVKKNVADFNVLDLKDRIIQLVDFINKSNGKNQN